MERNKIKIVQSYWSKGYNNMPNFGWAHRAAHFMCLALSCLQLRAYYDEVELITDEIGCELLIKKLKLPYTSVKVTLDTLNLPSYVWTAGKFEAYKAQDRPFIHVDGDIFIWNKFPSRIENAGLISQNIERNYPFNIDLLKEMTDLNFIFPLPIHQEEDMIEANMGIAGGHNLEFIQEYCNTAETFLESNFEKLSSLSKGEEGINTIMEQYLFYRLAEAKDIPIEYLIDEFPYTKMCFLTMFHLLPSPVGYIHCLGANKRTDISCDRVARLLRYLHPDKYDLIIKSLKNNIL